MAIYVYNAATGALYSYCPEDSDPVADPATLAASGLASVIGLPPLDPTHVWDAATRTVVAAALPLAPNIVGTSEWIMQFSPAEFAAIRASSDQAVQHFLFALTVAQTINLNSEMVRSGLAYLASINLLTLDRVTVLGAWTGAR
jgi:hypothetical protein